MRMPNERARTVWSYIWALSPLLSFGIMTPFAFAVAAARRRTLHLVLATVFYVVTFAFGYLTTSASALFTVFLFVTWLGGTVHALFVRRKVFAPASSLDRAVDLTRERRRLRAEAAKIARDDPMLAQEMRIGRPDLARTYDDGGLVDINNAPVEVLMHIPDMTPEAASAIVRVRSRCGGFSSAEEAAALAQLPPSLTPRLTGYGVFLP